MILDVTVVTALLVGAGFPLAYVLTDSLLLGIVAAPLVTAGLSALAGILVVTTRTGLTGWLLGFVAASWLCAVLIFRNRRHAATRSALDPWPLVGSVAVAIVPLTALRLPPVAWDANSIWFLHAQWFAAGGRAVVGAIRNPAYGFSHQDYPPLASATIASVWRVWHGLDLKVAQITIALVTISAVLTMVGAIQIRAGRSRWITILIAPLLTLAAIGVAGIYVTNGYVDLLWAAAIVAAIILLLTGDLRWRTAALGGICLAVAMLTKNEGTVAGLFVLTLALARNGRRLWHARRRLVLVGLIAVSLPAIYWAALARALGAPPDVWNGPRARALLRLDPSVTSRIGPSFHALWHFMSIDVLAAACITAAGFLVARRARRELGAQGSRWVWAAAVGCFLLLMGAYVISPDKPLPLQNLLASSADRTSIVLRLLALSEIAIWVLALQRSASQGMQVAISGKADERVLGGTWRVRGDETAETAGRSAIDQPGTDFTMFP